MSSENPESTAQKILQGSIIGGIIMVGQSPFINYFNNVSVVATKYNINWLNPYKQVYRGVEGAPSNTWLNFFRGIQAHFIKEIPRLLFKPTGLYVIKPELDKTYTPQQSACLFAGSLSIAEVVIANPPDSIRVQRQAGKFIDYSMRALYRGSISNGSRQFLSWWMLSVINQKLDNHFKNNGINTHSFLTIMIKSITIAATLSIIFPIERLKNELQHQSSSGYVKASRQIYAGGGVSRFFCGVGAKFFTNTIQAVGSIGLIEMGNQKLLRK